MLPTPNLEYSKDPFVVVSVHDTAIEWPAELKEEQKAKAEYQSTRDISKLTFKPNQEPTRFYLRLLPSFHYTNLFSKCVAWDPMTKSSQPNEAAICLAFFVACLSKVENTVKKDGTVIGVLHPKNSETFSTEEIDEYFPGPFVIQEMGFVAWKRHFLAQGLASRFV